MNGAHAELFTFCLFEKVLRPLSNQGRLAPLVLRDYQQIKGTDSEPNILMDLPDVGYYLGVRIQFREGYFVISIDCTSLPSQPDIVALLINSLGFVQDGDHIFRSVSPIAVEGSILELTQALAKAPQPTIGLQ
jgi:hypothetical protein